MIRVSERIVSDNPVMKSTKQKVPDNPGLNWRWYGLEDMKPDLLYDLLALREARSNLKIALLHPALALASAYAPEVVGNEESSSAQLAQTEW